MKPNNPFDLPALKDNEMVIPESLAKTACSIAAHYIAAREKGDAEMAYQLDLDIGAFLSEEFSDDQRDEQAQFRARFTTLVTDCNAAFGSLGHFHSRWAFDTEHV